MRIGPFGVPELLIVMVIVLLIFGAKRIPEISRSMGSGLRLFKKGLTEDEKATAHEEGNEEKDNTPQLS